MSDHEGYFDYSSTTPVDPRVAQAMEPYFSENFGNPNSLHRFGQRAEAAIEQARATVADLLGCQPAEIVFTSSATESDNLALWGAALAAREQREANHILISPVEHPAAAKTALALQHWFDFEVEYLPVDRYGMVSPEDVAARVRRETAVVSVIYANNEIGTLSPIQEIGAICQERGIPFHSDAVQAATFFPLKVNALHTDLLSLGGQKFYGPKGIGALYVRSGTPIEPMLHGGSQEHGLRASTQNTPLIVGFAKALQLVHDERQQILAHVKPLRDRLIEQLLQDVPDIKLTGHPIDRLPHHASFALRGVDSNALIAGLDLAGFACSSGSACKVGRPEPSSILLKIGMPPEWAQGALRITLGRFNTERSVEGLIAALPTLAAKHRQG